MKKFLSKRKKTHTELISMQERQKTPTFYISYRTYLHDSEGKGLFDYREQYQSLLFINGVYEMEPDTHFYFYKHANGKISISKTLGPNSQIKTMRLILWIKVQEIDIEGKQFYEIELKKPSELKERSNLINRNKPSLARAYSYGEKFKPTLDKEQQEIDEVPSNAIDEDICMVIKTFDEYELKTGSIVKFAYADNNLQKEYVEKFRYSLHFMIENLNIIRQIQEVKESEIKNNKGLHINHQKRELFCFQKTNELGAVCPYCTNQENQSLETTLVNFCKCKGDNVYCLRCLCEINQLEIQKNDYGHVNQGKIKLSMEIVCKTCKQPVPQYICIERYNQTTKEKKRHFFETISKQKKSKVILKNLKTGQEFPKELNEGEMQIGKKYGCWVFLEDYDCLEDNQASIFFKRATQKLHIRDNGSKYGTFVVEENPKILLNKQREEMSKSIQIGSTVISFRLNL